MKLVLNMNYQFNIGLHYKFVLVIVVLLQHVCFSFTEVTRFLDWQWKDTFK